MRTFMTTTATIYLVYNLVSAMGDSLGWRAIQEDRAGQELVDDGVNALRMVLEQRWLAQQAELQ